MRLTDVLLSATVLTVSLAAQTAAQTGAATVRTVATVPPSQTDTYVYQTDGRRDPFLALIGGAILEEVEGIKFFDFSHKDVVRHPLVSKIVNAYDRADLEKKAHLDAIEASQGRQGRT